MEDRQNQLLPKSRWQTLSSTLLFYSNEDAAMSTRLHSRNSAGSYIELLVLLLCPPLGDQTGDDCQSTSSDDDTTTSLVPRLL